MNTQRSERMQTTHPHSIGRVLVQVQVQVHGILFLRNVRAAYKGASLRDYYTDNLT